MVAAGRRLHLALADWAQHQLLNWAAVVSIAVYWGHWDCPPVAAGWAPTVAVAAEASGWVLCCSWLAAVAVQNLYQQRSPAGHFVDRAPAAQDSCRVVRL